MLKSKLSSILVLSTIMSLANATNHYFNYSVDNRTQHLVTWLETDTDLKTGLQSSYPAYSSAYTISSHSPSWHSPNIALTLSNFAIDGSEFIDLNSPFSGLSWNYLPGSKFEAKFVIQMSGDSYTITEEKVSNSFFWSWF